MALASSLENLITQVGNTSNLILDPDLDSFYLMDTLVVQIPRALIDATAVADVPDSGTRNAIIAVQAVRAGSISSAADAIRSDLATTRRSTSASELAAELADADTFAARLSGLAGQVTDTLDDARPTGVDPSPMAGSAMAAIDSTVEALDRLLAIRVDGLAAQRVGHIDADPAGGGDAIAAMADVVDDEVFGLSHGAHRGRIRCCRRRP
jgi:hypothetical protein